MNASLMSLEIAVVAIGLAVLALDLYLPAPAKRWLGYGAAAALGLVLLGSLGFDPAAVQFAFGKTFVMDGLALFFKRLFLVAAILVLIMSVEFSDRILTGMSEFYSLTVMALAGMMFAASANDFAVLFVSVELITITFYILTSFQRHRTASLEAGIKYLILGAVSSAFLVYGIALIYGVSGTMGFAELRLQAIDLMERPVFLMGLLMVLAGLGFKIAAFPMQIWAPDVYQGAPAPVAAFLAVGSKAAGMVLLLRVFFSVVTEVSEGWEKLWMALSAMTILYGNLCAIPQRNLKRLLGYSSIANAGYLLLGAAAVSAAGSSAILYYLAGYLFTVMAAFTVICLAMRQSGAEEIGELAGLHRRSPLLAASMTLAMVSLAGVPPMAGFFGKFLLFRAVAQQASAAQGYYWLMGVAVVGVAISIWYYFGVIRAIYWSEEPVEASPIAVSLPARVSLYVCVAGMIYLGVFPGAAVGMADAAVKALHF